MRLLYRTHTWLLLLLISIMISVCANAMPLVEELAPRPAADAWNEYWGHDDHICYELPFTGSMKPNLQGGEYIMARKFVPCEIPRIHSLVVVARWDRWVTHEVVAVNARSHWVKTQGTNCLEADGWYPPERIKYVVERIVRVVNK